jgi:hypothetical protein
LPGETATAPLGRGFMSVASRKKEIGRTSCPVQEVPRPKEFEDHCPWRGKV